MKKLVFLLVLGLFILPSAVAAINLGGDLAAGAAREAGYDPGTTETTLAETLGTVIKTALSLVGVVFLSLMVYAGYLWMTARGEESQVEKAQKMIRSAVIGLIITVAAHSITSFVVPRIVERTAGAPSRQTGQQQRGGGQTGLCNWGTGNSPNATRAFCADQCRIAARNSINCRFNGENARPACSWDSGSMEQAANQDVCFTQCITVGRSRVTCSFEGVTMAF